jgi:CBS domain containing-hemolysin-like protein
MAVLGRVPAVGDEIEIPGAVLRVERMDGRRVDRLRAVRRTPSVQEEER